MINRLIERIREPFLEVLLTAEDLRHQEMHERPELHHIVLKRRTCKQESALSI